MTSFQSASNTVEDLATIAALEKTHLVVVTGDDPDFGSKENVAPVNGGGGEGEGGEGEAETLENVDFRSSQEVVFEFGKSFGKISSHNSHDSCVGSSIAGDTSSGFRTSTILVTPDTSDTSFAHSTDTSANSDYIATSCESSQSPPLPRRPLDLDTGHTIASSSCADAPSTKKTKQTCSDGGTSAAELATDDFSTSREKRTFAKTKDYIHATNALFIDRSPDHTV